MAKAVRFDRYGGTDVLYIADVDIPVPGGGRGRRAGEGGRHQPG